MKQRGFTLIEIMIATVVSVFIIFALMQLMTGNLSSFFKGKRDIALQTEIQKVMKAIFLGIKSANAPLFFDKNFNILIANEDRKDISLNNIYLLDMDNNLSNGAEKLRFKVYSLEKIEDFNIVEIYHEKNKLGKFTGRLIKKVYDRSMNLINTIVITKYLSEIHFKIDLFDRKAIKVSAEIDLKKEQRQGKKKLKEKFDFCVRIENELVSAKM